MRTSWALVGVAAAGLLLTGCGGSTPSTLPVPEEPAAVEGVEPAPGATLPADWPSDIPTPASLTLVNAIKLDSPQGPTWSGTWQGSGDPGQVYDELADAMRAAGYTDEGGIGGTGEGGITTWVKNGMRVQLTVLLENGQVAVNITALNEGA